jgi:outer membrane protein assembly factor BamB
MGALDAATGRLLWTAPVAPARELAVGPNLIVAVGGGTVTALTQQGRLLWSDRLPGHDPEPGGSVLAIDKHMVYVAEEGTAPVRLCSPN